MSKGKAKNEKLNKWKPPHCNKGEVENQAQSIFLKLVRCHWHAASEILCF